MDKISVITVCYNSGNTIEDTIRSVVSQDYLNKEYIIIDGGSEDNTLEIAARYKNGISTLISEKDKGMYDAINKGIALASGDIIAILNSDDFYVNETILSEVVAEFDKKKVDSVYCDLQYVERDNTDTVKRNWKAGAYEEGMFYKGWMPPHPAFFLKKKCYDAYGCFNTTLKSAADYELMLRMLHVKKVSTSYLPILAVKMRTGGKSNISVANRIKANREDLKAWQINHVKPHLFTLIRKPLSKLGQFLKF
jgi:glycosyltransferase involved in cell wall biosynthesis